MYWIEEQKPLRVEDRSSTDVQILQNDNEKIKMQGIEKLV